MKVLRKLILGILAFPKTVFFNFWYLSFKDAIQLPILVSHRVWLMELGGKISLSQVRPGVVKIGFGEVGIFDQHRSRTIWQVSGAVEFKGTANIGHGSKLSVSGKLVLGDRFSISAESAIVASHSVTIGDNVMVSWDALIIDTDFHKLHDAGGNHLNPAAPVSIGNRVWVGCRCLILKGVDIPDGVVLAAATTVSKSVATPGAVVGRSPASVIRENITWSV